MVAERYGTDHEEYVVEPDAVAVLPRLVWHYGEPFADPSAIPTYYVSEMARRKVTVALNGDGGDEAFLGYSRYHAMRHLARARPVAAMDRLALSPGCFPMAPRGLQRELKLPQIRDVLDRFRRAPGAALCRDDRVLRRSRQGEPVTARRCAAVSAHSALDWLAPYFAARGGLVAGANWADSTPICPTI